MNLYHIPAVGSVDEPEGIHPDFGIAEAPLSWSGVYDEASNSYVVSTEDTIEGFTPLEPGEDVGFPYAVPREDNSPA